MNFTMVVEKTRGLLHPFLAHKRNLLTTDTMSYNMLSTHTLFYTNQRERETETETRTETEIDRKKVLKTWQRWDSNPRLRRDWCLKPAP